MGDVVQLVEWAVCDPDEGSSPSVARHKDTMRKLIIGVTQELSETPEIKALSPRTCDVRIVNLDEYDIVMSAKAWFMPQVNLRYLAPAIKMVRKLVKLKEI